MKLGYLIANGKAEYIAGCCNSGALLILWTKNPVDAVVFPKRSVARFLVRNLRCTEPLWVLQLFETEQHIFVGTQDRNRPSWLTPFLSPSLPARKCSRADEVRRATA